MQYVADSLDALPAAMSARLLAFLMTSEGAGPSEEYKCLKKHPQLMMRTHVRALATIASEVQAGRDDEGAFAICVKLCNLRAAARWGVEHYQRRIQVEGIESFYAGVPLPGGAASIGQVLTTYEDAQQRNELAERESNLAAAYPKLHLAMDASGAARSADGKSASTGTVFRNEFGHLSESAQQKFRQDSLWMGDVESQMESAEAKQVKARLRRSIGKGLGTTINASGPTIDELTRRKRLMQAREDKKEEKFQQGLSKISHRTRKAALPKFDQPARRPSAGGRAQSAAAGAKSSRPVWGAGGKSSKPATESSLKVDEHYYEGLRANAAGKYSDAVRHFTTAITGDKCRSEVYSSRGIAYFVQGEYEAAVSDFTQCMRLVPAAPLPYYYRGKALARLGAAKGALADYHAALDKETTSHALAARGELLLEMGDPVGALADLTQARGIEPRDSAVCCLQGQAYAVLQRYKKAEECCTDAIVIITAHAVATADDGEQTENSDDSASESAATFVTGTDTESLRGTDSVLSSRGPASARLPSGAQSVASEAEIPALDGGVPVPEGGAKPEACEGADAARIRKLAKRRESALQVARDKLVAEALCFRGNARWEMDCCAEAVADYEEAVRLDPACAMAFHLLGCATASEGRLDDALKHLACATELAETLTVAHYQRAIVHSRLDEHSAAVASLTICVEQSRDDPQAQAMYLCQRGVAHSRSDALRKATDDYTAALRADPWLDAAWCSRGTAYALLGRQHRSARDHARATELDFHHEACLLARECHCQRLSKMLAPAEPQ